jgi:hypothetical protein
MDNCQHIKANGIRCGSPSMNHSAFCFFHTDVPLRRKHKRMPLPILEDTNSVQLALNQVAARIMDDGADLRKTGQLLYMLQLCSQNIARTKFEQILSSLRERLALDYTPALEAEMQSSAGGSVNTPAMQAGVTSMYAYRDELLRQQKEAGQQSAAPDQPPTTGEPLKKLPRPNGGIKPDPSLRSG